MNSESPTQKVKSCNACKRSLPTYFFGIRRFSEDGYNPCCKECRNFRRRRAYQSPFDSEDLIFPLNEHNRYFLLSIPESVTKESLIGLDLKALTAAQVFFVRKNRNEFQLTVKITAGSQYTHIYGGTKSGFIGFVLPLLAQLSIRLFYPCDTNALSNWGFKPHSRVQFQPSE